MGDFQYAATGRALDAIAEHYGLARESESDDALRARILRSMNGRVLVTLNDVDSEVRALLDRVMPIALDPSRVRHRLAIRWLREQRPHRLWARVRWAWRIVRAVL